MEGVLNRLGLGHRPAPDADGLARVYRAWCRSVSFDNVVKRIHLASGDPAPLPNGPPEAFFGTYLRHGTGGTCWPSSAGLYALLAGLGFDVRRGSAAMRDDVVGPIHTHGTLLVRLADVDDGGADHWVDTSMLTDRVLPLSPGEETAREDPLHPFRAEPVGPMWRIWWAHPFLPERVGCLLLADDVTAEHYQDRYEWSRGSSPFNAALYATRNTPAARITVAFGQRFERTVDGTTNRVLGDGERERILIEEFGYSEEIVAALPADDTTPLPSTS